MGCAVRKNDLALRWRGDIKLYLRSVYLPRYLDLALAAEIAAGDIAQTLIHHRSNAHLGKPRFRWLDAENVAIVELTYAAERVVVEGYPMPILTSPPTATPISGPSSAPSPV